MESRFIIQGTTINGERKYYAFHLYNEKDTYWSSYITEARNFKSLKELSNQVQDSKHFSTKGLQDILVLEIGLLQIRTFEEVNKEGLLEEQKVLNERLEIIKEKLIQLEE